ncbi:MAG: hypothetical protein ACK4XK_08720, partial [Casimicrobiaceae bacterium]
EVAKKARMDAYAILAQEPVELITPPSSKESAKAPPPATPAINIQGTTPAQSEQPNTPGSK